MTTIYFIRHCEPDYSNHNDLLRPLTEKGQRDAEKLTGYFKSIPVDVVCSSPYKRAFDTVASIAGMKGKEIETFDDLRERCVSGGDWVDDIGNFMERQWQDHDYKFPLGESLSEVESRNISALRTILRKHIDETVVIGSHGTALSTIVYHYDKNFGYKDFMRIVKKMPWCVKFVFESEKLIYMDKNVEIV